MAMGIFDQLAWLTTRVKRLCCAIKVGALQSRSIDATPLEVGIQYDITEGGIYQFYGGTGQTLDLGFSYPTSVGQTMYIYNISNDTFTVLGLNGADRPFEASTTNPIVSINSNQVWQLISVDGTASGYPHPIWRGIVLFT